MACASRNASADPTGSLAYTPVANQNGVAHITLHAHDDGGTGGGGVDTSAIKTFTITVRPLYQVYLPHS